MSQFDVLQRINAQNNQLLMAGKTAEQLIAIAGGAPLFVYDTKVMTRQFEKLQQALPQSVRIHYAIKANPHMGVLNHMAKLVHGFDLASHGELVKALATGMLPERISFAGPAKSELELRAAITAGVKINVESELELQRIGDLGEQLNIRPKIAFRVNPDFELKAAGMKMAGGSKPFGIDAEQIPYLLSLLHSQDFDFQGFHIFTGSQNLRPDSIIQNHQRTFLLAEELACEAERFSLDVKYLNIGGGLGVPYFQGELAIELDDIGANLQTLLDGRSLRLQDTEVVMELGRYLVAESGVYLCQVTDVKGSRGKNFVITNGGMHHHLANSGNLGQMIRRNYPVVMANQLESGEDNKIRVDVVGPLCTPLDILAANIELPDPKVGDVIAVLQSGAYGASASPQDFLSHPHARELVL
ncbi:pyridoxal-dependent decarboxylase, exosortase A system-associated [Paraneptunicella aestuarii]|uniref:pyridoxal-dependent decarboxylase, exosortase A system-associated n=1 Tax=Paraneptunicella aestuarii TaxID=2831148 RepID=UPI001E4ACEA7|nr:pyridoxal-dependent decarboxylase, exosortase A system-associated [Paraneptunicella aestuarii]UAA39270.1 pyridoxal-dependent decarboxylase, exosortase A system-associated [Paraneptunicella aestuarii]